MSNSIIVEIKRITNSAHTNKKGAELFEGQAKKSIGSYFKKGSTKTATGLGFNELDLLMPYILDFDTSDREFRKEVTAYFDAIDTKIPSEGLKLEIGLKDNSKELGVDLSLSDKPYINLPLNIEDYITYFHVKGHPHVAPSLDSAKGNYIKMYYIVDEAQQRIKADDSRKLEDKALGYYLEHKGDNKKVKQILTYLGISLIDPISGKAKILEEEFKKASTSDPKAFIKCVEDEDLPLVALANVLVSKKIIAKEGNRYIFENKQLGNTLKDFVEYLKDDANSETIIILKARLAEAS